MRRDQLFVITILIVLLCGGSYLNGRADGRRSQRVRDRDVHNAYELAMVTFIAGSTHADGRWNSLLDDLRSENGIPTSPEQVFWDALELPFTENTVVKSPDDVDILRRFEVGLCTSPDCEFPYEAPVENALERGADHWRAKMGNVGHILHRYHDAGRVDSKDVNAYWATYDIGPAETYNSAACAYNMIRGSQHALPLIYHGPSWLVADSN